MKMGLRDLLKKINWFINPYLLVISLCLLIKLRFTREEIYFAVNEHNSPLADKLAPYATDIGNGWTAVALSLLLLLFNYRKAFLLATSYAITSILAQVVKFIFDKPRPKMYFNNRLSEIHFVKGVDILSTHSFPSGHTITAFSAAVIFTYFSKNKAWGLVYLLIAITVGYSRMYLSQHFFEDVTAGSVLGVIITIFWLYWIDNRQFINHVKWQQGLLSKRL